MGWLLAALYRADEFRRRTDPFCQLCRGTGGDETPCPECNGTGHSRYVRDFFKRNAQEPAFAHFIQKQTERRAQRWPGQ